MLHNNSNACIPVHNVHNIQGSDWKGCNDGVTIAFIGRSANLLTEFTKLSAYFILKSSVGGD